MIKEKIDNFKREIYILHSLSELTITKLPQNCPDMYKLLLHLWLTLQEAAELGGDCCAIAPSIFARSVESSHFTLMVLEPKSQLFEPYAK